MGIRNGPTVWLSRSRANRAFARHQLAERPGPARRSGSKLRRSRSRRQGGTRARTAIRDRGRRLRRVRAAAHSFNPCEPAVRVARTGGRRRTVRLWRQHAEDRADARRRRLRRRLRSRVRPTLSRQADMRGRRERPLPCRSHHPQNMPRAGGYVRRRTASRPTARGGSRTNVLAEKDLRVCRRPAERCKRR
jgi:hypothetical protein